MTSAEVLERIDVSRNKLVNICKRYELIQKESASLLKDLEEYEHFYCKDSIGREIGISYFTKIKEMKLKVGGIYSASTKLGSFISKLPLAFDAARSLAESNKR